MSHQVSLTFRSLPILFLFLSFPILPILPIHAAFIPHNIPQSRTSSELLADRDRDMVGVIPRLARSAHQMHRRRALHCNRTANVVE